MFYTPATMELSAAGKSAAETLIRVAGSVIPATSPHLFGTWSIADADLAFMLHRLILNRHPLPARVAEWAAAQWQRPSVQEFVTHPREPYKYY
jgi:glutathione S-transferase